MKKIATLSALVLGLICATAAVPAFADVTLYDNTGPGSYNTFAYTINNGSVVADSFTLSSNSIVTGVNFVAWLEQAGSTLTSVDWQITTAPFGGTTEGSGTVSPTGTFVETDPLGDGFDIDNETFSIASLPLDAGTYYLELQNGVASGDGFVLWDESDGPSVAYSGNTDGGIPSETFQIEGTIAPTPEPSSFLLLGSGLAALAGLAKRKLMA